MYGPDELMRKLSGSVNTITALVESLGGSNSAAAMAITGRDESALPVKMRSKEYNAALRSVQRYLAQESAAAGLPSAKQQRGGSKRGIANRLKFVRKAQANKLRKKKTLNAEAPGEIWISQDLYQRNVRTFGFKPVTPVDVDVMLREFVEGRAQEAWDAFARGLLDGYGMPNSSYNNEREIDDLYLSWS